MVTRSDVMNTAARNGRIYNQLKDMGLFVSVQNDPDNPTDIDSIIVSAGVPKTELYSIEAAKEYLELCDKGTPPPPLSSFDFD